MKPLWQWVLVLFLLVAPAPAHAQDAAARAEARAHFQEGLSRVRSGDLLGAIDAFESAYRTSPHYAVLYNLGQAYAALGRPVEAVHAFDRFLTEGGSEIGAARRAEVEALVARERAQLSRLELSVSPREAEVFLDGRKLGVGPFDPQEVVAGEHVLYAQADGAAPRLQTLSLVAGQVTHIDLGLEPLPAPAPVIPPPAIRPEHPAPTCPASSQGRSQRIWAVGVGVGAAVLGGAAAAIFAWNTHRYDDWSKERDQLAQDFADGTAGGQGLAQATNLSNRATDIQRVDDLALGMAVAAGGALITAGVLWLTSPRPPRTAAASAH